MESSGSMDQSVNLLISTKKCGAQISNFFSKGMGLRKLVFHVKRKVETFARREMEQLGQYNLDLEKIKGREEEAGVE